MIAAGGGDGFLQQAFVYLAAGVVAVPVATRLGLGSVLGYLLAGVIIGPFALGLLGDDAEGVMHFAEFGVVMMLFLIGLELQPALLWRLRGPILGLGGLQVAVTLAAVAGVSMALGLPLNQGVAVGMIFALSSTAIVLQTLNEKGLMKTEAGQASFCILLFQDIAVIPMLALMPLLALGGDGGGQGVANAGPDGWAKAGLVAGVVVAIVLAGRFLVRPVFRMIAAAGLREVFTAAALTLVVGIALAMQKVGLSPALGTFLAGVVLANNEYRHELEADVEPFKGLLLGVFFISVGAAIDFDVVTGQPGVAAALVVGLVVLKFAVLLALARGFKVRWSEAWLVAFALAQGGEFAFVLTTFALQSSVLDDRVGGLLTATVALSMVATPLLLIVHDRFVRPRFSGVDQPVDAPAVEDEGNPVIIAGFGRFGQGVGRLLRANGVTATLLDLDAAHIDLLRKFGFKVFYGDASRLDLLHAAGAHHAKLLIVAIDDHSKALEIIDTARRHFPHLEILARAFGRREAYAMLQRGVEHVERETLGSSLELGVDALCALGHTRHRAYRSARSFRRHETKAVRELVAHWGDDSAYIPRARQRLADLEALLRADLADLDHAPENAWDPPTVDPRTGDS